MLALKSITFRGNEDYRKAPLGERSVDEAEKAYRNGVSEMLDDYPALARDYFETALYFAPDTNIADICKYENALGTAISKSNENQSLFRIEDFNTSPDRNIYHHFPRFILSNTESEKHTLQSYVDAYKTFRRAQDYNYHTPDNLKPVYFLNAANSLFELSQRAQYLAKLQLAVGKKLAELKGSISLTPQINLLKQKALIADQAEKQYNDLSKTEPVFQYIC